MLINGEKWACETCIKGHRATHCKHTDRQLIIIKKKGRPSTQCKRCRELRVIRQLHVKCDCEEDQSLRITTKKKKEPNKNSNSSIAVKKKRKIDLLRRIAPKQENIVTTTTTTSPSPAAGCCSSNKSKKDQEASFTTTNNVVTQSTTTIPIPIESVPLPNIPPPSSCCGPPSKNQQGQMIRVVTCRCGDSCACIGCDAHPSRAMKEGINDVYVGFDNANGNPPQQQRDNYQLSNIIGNNRRLSIAAICAANSSNSSSLPKLYTQQQQETDHPTSILSEDGVLLCGCGCSKTFEDCSDCFRELCQTYL